YVAEISDELAPWTVWGRLGGLLAVAQAFAPFKDWSWLSRVVRRLERRVTPVKAKHARLRPSSEIFTWAIERMDQIEREPPTRDAECQYRDALIIALLTVCPGLRLGNLAAIEIDRHLLRQPKSYTLRFAAAEMKTRRPFETPVPASLDGYLDRYMHRVRPVLLGAYQGARLWITRYGRPMRSKALYNSITVTTQRAFGQAINPHLFRDCAATTIAIEDPKHIGVAPLVLGHSDPRTTEAHYIQAQQIEAGRKLAQSIESLRKAYRVGPRGRGRQ
ncbi:MAG: site-specific integrase, partial [Pseudomonadota bacterium]